MTKLEKNSIETKRKKKKKKKNKNKRQKKNGFINQTVAEIKNSNCYQTKENFNSDTS